MNEASPLNSGSPAYRLPTGCKKVNDASGHRSSCFGCPTLFVGGIVTALVSATGRPSSNTRCGRSRRPAKRQGIKNVFKARGKGQ